MLDAAGVGFTPHAIGLLNQWRYQWQTPWRIYTKMQ